jgi:prophage tail gpP-like protein
MDNTLWQCPYAPIECTKIIDCSLCWDYLSLEIYGIQQILDKLTKPIGE